MTTLMCGDGTNDVGALKRAHVGVSIVSAPAAEGRQKMILKKESELRKRKKVAAKTKKQQQQQQQQQQGHGLLHKELEMLNQSGSEVVQLGDASIASPFTSKSSSISCVLQIIKQGRCTLVTTLQMYKILGVNCLVTAYMLSSLYTVGVKQGDTQLTILGLGIAAIFMLPFKASLFRHCPRSGRHREFFPRLCCCLSLDNFSYTFYATTTPLIFVQNTLTKTIQRCSG